METFNGTGVSKGYAIGTAYVIEPCEKKSAAHTAGNSCEEAERLKGAVELSKRQVKDIAQKASRSLDGKNAGIIESQINFLDDPAFVGQAFTLIKGKNISAETAVSHVADSLYAAFSHIDDDYIKERAADIKDIGDRILKNLAGEKSGIDFENMPENTVLFAHDLKPSDTAQIDKSKVSAFVTEAGGRTSHTAILAKAFGIAAVVGCKGMLGNVKTGDKVITDGVSGTVLINPDEKELSKYTRISEKFKTENAKNTAAAKRAVYTKAGKRITVAANIGTINDLKTAISNGAEGVGLFRTEFLYMDRSDMPSEEEQFEVYKKAAQMLDGRPLTIRTLDIGGDKSLPYLNLPKESNPFLGLRAIRLCLKDTGIFKPQLRAILRASAFGNIQIMFPMISSLGELSEAKGVLESCKAELRRRGEAFDSCIKTGMMVEIPSAAIMADSFAGHVDFFSIGTNDLTQYTLAADRLNENASELYNPMNPAVLKLIQMTINAAHAASIPCCMCGELASDEKAAAVLLGYGLDEFSVSPGAITETKSNLLKKASAGQ